MKIIAHRGNWKNPDEKNSQGAFERAFLKKYGVETDIRDYCGELVISHNVADCQCMACDDFFDLYQRRGNGVPLALNIKADGIQKLLKPLLEKYQITNYFVFDMSIPEMVVYKYENIRFFTRRSDIENKCVLYHDASGVWIDAFYNDTWKVSDYTESVLNDGKDAVIVSPELHGRDKSILWDEIKNSGLYAQDGLYLCTDCPDEAEKVFIKGR